jgi:hypothetical protein
VELPPGLELGIAQLGAEGATLGAINDVVGQLTSDPSNALTTLFEAPATILNALLNGQDNVSLLDGIINIPAFNGILAPPAVDERGPQPDQPDRRSGTGQPRPEQLGPG